jgi:hypothetical protein
MYPPAVIPRLWGTQFNGTDLITGVQAPLRDGDRITLGARTAITVHAT